MDWTLDNIIYAARLGFICGQGQVRLGWQVWSAYGHLFTDLVIHQIILYMRPGQVHLRVIPKQSGHSRELFQLTRKIPSRTLRVDIAIHFVFVSNCFMSHSVQFTVQECKQTNKMTSPETNYVRGSTPILSEARCRYPASLVIV